MENNLELTTSCRKEEKKAKILEGFHETKQDFIAQKN